jgi:hypothetical protein
MKPTTPAWVTRNSSRCSRTVASADDPAAGTGTTNSRLQVARADILGLRVFCERETGVHLRSPHTASPVHSEFEVNWLQAPHRAAPERLQGAGELVDFHFRLAFFARFSC